MLRMMTRGDLVGACPEPHSAAGRLIRASRGWLAALTLRTHITWYIIIQIESRKKMMILNKPRNKPLIHKFTVRLDEPTYVKLNQMAWKSNQSLVECVRTLISKGNVRVKVTQAVELPELKPLTVELSRIGNNLNQIARYYNGGGSMTAQTHAMLNEAVRQLFEMKYKIDRLGGE